MTIKAPTMSLKGNNYAKVAERLKLFREDYPAGKIETVFEQDADGSTVFNTYIWKDKQDLMQLMTSGVVDSRILRSSADANGSARGVLGSKEKDFEKLETVATGRALAMLGYLASGEIASSEEMEEFLKDKHSRIDEAINQINSCKDIEALQKVFIGLGKLKLNTDVIAAKDKKKLELS